MEMRRRGHCQIPLATVYETMCAGVFRRKPEGRNTVGSNFDTEAFGPEILRSKKRRMSRDSFTFAAHHPHLRLGWCDGELGRSLTALPSPLVRPPSSFSSTS